MNSKAIYNLLKCSQCDHMDHERETTKGTAAFDRGLVLLQALLRDDGATSLRDIAESLAIPWSTARRLAATMERHGVVMRTARGRFASGTALIDLPRHDPHEQLARAARPTIRALARKLSLTAHVGVFEDQMVTYIAKEQARGKPLFTRENRQLEAYCSGVGKVVLAALPPVVQEAYLAAGDFVALTPRTITNVDALRAELKAVRMQGYAIDDEEAAQGLFCIGVPIRARDATVIAALSISGHKDRFDRHGLTALVLSLNIAADEIARRFGHGLSKPMRRASI